MIEKLLRTLASLKLAVILLVLLLVALAGGTIVESTRGAPAAQEAVYYASWFLGLQALFVVNVCASIASLFPWGRPRIGFLTTHSAIVLIMFGAVVSYFFKAEGQLGLWEGQRGDEVVDHDRQGNARAVHKLPFVVEVVDFRIDHYPGTMRPANFRSDVRIIEPSGTFDAAIWMNHPLEHRGWTLFQSSYQQQNGREATIFSVSRDPGQNIVFVGYALLVLGMCIVLGTRITQARAKARARDAAVRGSGRGVGVAASVAAVLAAAAPARAADPADAIARLPVQHDGRVMALDTLAREAVWRVTGRKAWNGEPPVETVTRWMTDPAAATREPVVKLGSAELAATAGVPGATHASFDQLVRSRAVLQLFDEARRAAAAEERRQGVVADAEKLEERLVVMQRFLRREAVRSLPAPVVTQQWSPAPVFDAPGLAAMANGPRLQGWPEPAAIDREVTYNSVRPTRVAWIVLAIALVASLASWKRRSRALDAVALAGLVAGFAVMTWGILTRWAIAGRAPASNMYESMLFLGWGVGLFAVVAVIFLRSNRLLLMNANAGAALAMALTDLLPMDGFIHPVPPVLAGTVWLAIHVPIIMVGYAVLALGLVIAHVQLGYQALAPNRPEGARRAHELLYWYMHVGNILLLAGILTGSVWAASSWGRYWGWDPKEVWSLVAFLAYMAILHARVERWLGPFGVAALSIAAFQTILMTYLGVNYVLGTGLHSYGFGDSPVLTWMVIVAAAEIAFLGWATAAWRRSGRAELAAA
jgi:cytochrome c-type biogenesis protein CcsB